MNTTNTNMGSSLTKSQVLAAVEAAWTAPFTPQRASGCGRVYVIVPKAHATAVAAAAKKLGIIFQRKAHYGLSNALYVGYDNADGRALARGEAIAAALKSAGIDAYSEACSD